MRAIRFVLVCGLFLAACSTTRPDRPDAPAPREETPSRPVTRTVQGYRVQLLTTPDKATADQQVEQALTWWKGLATAQRPPYMTDSSNRLDVDVKWKQPYYRVHVGAFATRAEADRALRAVAGRFPDALIVPETVTVTR